MESRHVRRVGEIQESYTCRYYLVCLSPLLLPLPLSRRICDPEMWWPFDIFTVEYELRANDLHPLGA